MNDFDIELARDNESMAKELDLLKKKMDKVLVIYTDGSFLFDKDNVFLSLPYNNLSDFKRSNDGMIPISSYKLKDIIMAGENENPS